MLSKFAAVSAMLTMGIAPVEVVLHYYYFILFFIIIIIIIII